MKTKLIISSLGISLLSLVATGAQSSSPTGNTITVTVDNFPRAESDLYMGNGVKDGGFGKFVHKRVPADIEHQLVIRMNRDTLYSSEVLYLYDGPVTITLPDAGKRFMSLQVINEDHYAPM